MLFLIKLSLALVVMALVLYFSMGETAAWLQFSLIQRLISLTGLVLMGGASYFATLFLLGFRPRDYIRRVNR
jgi:putative peptidoglycan lipid II flippase